MMRDLISFFPPELAILEDNKELENILSEFKMPKMQYGTLRIAGFGEEKPSERSSPEYLKTHKIILWCIW